MQGQISTAINNTQIVKDGKTTLLKDDYNRTVAKVDSINSTIGTHTTKIDQLTGNITSVDTKVNSVQRDLEGTKSTVSSHTTQINGLNSTVSTQGSSISQLKDKIALKVEASDITNAVNNIQVGGRNIITKDINNISKWTMKYPDRMQITNNGYDNTYILKNASGGWETVISNGITVIPNKEYVLSFEYEVFKNYTNLSGFTFRLEVLKEKTNADNSSVPYAIAYHVIENVVTPKKRVSIKFTPTVSTIYLMLNGGYINDKQTDIKFSFNKFKLEQGNKATDWTAAPEDVDNAISSVDNKVTSTNSKVAVIETDLNIYC